MCTWAFKISGGGSTAATLLPELGATTSSGVFIIGEAFIRQYYSVFDADNS